MVMPTHFPPLTRRQALGLLGALTLPWDKMIAQTPAAATAMPSASTPTPAVASLPPDLANLYPVLDWIARDHPPTLSFLDSRWRDLETWKKTARPAYKDLLHYQPTAS